jgi:hypothetical protein
VTGWCKNKVRRGSPILPNLSEAFRYTTHPGSGIAPHRNGQVVDRPFSMDVLPGSSDFAEVGQFLCPMCSPLLLDLLLLMHRQPFSNLDPGAVEYGIRKALREGPSASHHQRLIQDFSDGTLSLYVM